MELKAVLLLLLLLYVCVYVAFHNNKENKENPFVIYAVAAAGNDVR